MCFFLQIIVCALLTNSNNYISACSKKALNYSGLKLDRFILLKNILNIERFKFINQISLFVYSIL